MIATWIDSLPYRGTWMCAPTFRAIHMWILTFHWKTHLILFLALKPKNIEDHQSWQESSSGNHEYLRLNETIRNKVTNKKKSNWGQLWFSESMPVMYTSKLLSKPPLPVVLIIPLWKCLSFGLLPFKSVFTTAYLSASMCGCAHVCVVTFFTLCETLHVHFVCLQYVF